MTLSHKIVGNAMQLVVCQVADGQTVYAEAGKFLWKTTNVDVQTRISSVGAPPAASTAGLLNMAVGMGKRVLAGESLALQHFTATGGTGLVSLAGTLPGELRALELDGTTGWLAQGRVRRSRGQHQLRHRLQRYASRSARR